MSEYRDMWHAAEKELAELRAKIEQLEAERDKWHDRAMRRTPGFVEGKLEAEVERLEAELEQERVQHAGCLVAAEGHAYCEKGAYGWSLAGQTAADLHAEVERLNAKNKELRDHPPLLLDPERSHAAGMEQAAKIVRGLCSGIREEAESDAAFHEAAAAIRAEIKEVRGE